MIKTMDFKITFYNEKGKKIIEETGGTDYEALGLDKSVNFIRDRLRHDIKEYK